DSGGQPADHDRRILGAGIAGMGRSRAHEPGAAKGHIYGGRASDGPAARLGREPRRTRAGRRFGVSARAFALKQSDRVGIGLWAAGTLNTSTRTDARTGRRGSRRSPVPSHRPGKLAERWIHDRTARGECLESTFHWRTRSTYASGETALIPDGSAGTSDGSAGTSDGSAGTSDGSAGTSDGSAGGGHYLTSGLSY